MRWVVHVALIRMGDEKCTGTGSSLENMREIGGLEDPEIDGRFP